MSRDPLLAQLSLRVPHRLLQDLDAIGTQARLTSGVIEDAQDHYVGGRSAIARLLLEWAIRQHKANRHALDAMAQAPTPANLHP